MLPILRNRWHHSKRLSNLVCWPKPGQTLINIKLSKAKPILNTCKVPLVLESSQVVENSPDSDFPMTDHGRGLGATGGADLTLEALIPKKFQHSHENLKIFNHRFKHQTEMSPNQFYNFAL